MIMLNDFGAEPQFVVGQVVRHRRYGYRGVVVARDRSCQASDDWYQSNQTQPPKDKPWYHVLVHEAGHSTYAAESSLQAEQPASEISHPALPMFFNGFADGQYQRNDTPWQGWV